jgi:PKD repeat protein
LFRSRSNVFVAAVVSAFVLATAGSLQAQTCSANGGPSQQAPQYTGTSSGITSTAGGNQHLYVDTEWGVARFSLANPAAPAPGTVGMIGLDVSQGAYPSYNGGVVPIHVDSHQGPTWYGAAEAPDGTARVVTDWSPAINQGDGLNGHVVMAAAAGPMAFGQSINGPKPDGPGEPIAVAYVGGGFYSYSYMPGGISITNVTSPNGSPGLTGGQFGYQDPTLALQPIGSFGVWGSPNTLSIANVTMGGVGKTLLVGSAAGVLHVAYVNSNGTLTDSGVSAAPSGYVYAVNAVNVGTKVILFTAEGSQGIRGYEFTGSALVPGVSYIAGTFDYLVVRGSYPNLIIAAHNPPARQIQTFDTKWMLTGNGTPVVGPAVVHDGAANNYFGKWVESVVAGNTAYLYRLGNGTPEKNLYTDVLDVSCLTADLTSPPVANATFTNKSAASRSGVEATINYYGDRFVFTDASASGQPIKRVDWDLNTAGNVQADFVPDASLGTGTSIGGVPGFVWPCDPVGSGNPTTGQGCPGSVGLSTTPGSASFKFGEKSSNINGPATLAFFSAPVTFVMPQAKVANMVGGTLSVLTGGSADSSPTQGHPTSFMWTFVGGAGGSSNLPVAPVPAGTTSFTLTVGYDGGYTATTSGNVTITDIVPSFSLNPTTTSLGGSLLLTNTMQIAAGATVQSVDYFVMSGGCPGNPGTPTGTLAATFNTQGGTATITAPTTAGGYCVALRYHYVPPSGGTAIVSPVQPSQALSVLSAALTASVLANPTSVAPNAATSLTATASGGVPPYSYAWDCNFSLLGGGNFGTASSVTTSTCSWANSGGRTPAVKVTDSTLNSTTAYASVTVTGTTGGSISGGVSGNTAPGVGTPTTYTAVNVSGGTGVYTYAWACDYTPLFPAFNTGSSSVSCSFSSTGTKTVAVKITDTGSGFFVGQLNVNVGGGTPGPGGLAVTVTGPSTGSQNQALTFNAVGTGGTPGYTFAWACDYTPVGGNGQFSGSGSSKTCTFGSNGPHVVAARVTDSTSATAIGLYTTNITGPALPSAAFTVTGATLSGTTVTVGKGQAVTFTSSEPNCSSWGWDFGDGTSGTGRTITKTYSTVGTYPGTLIVTGNGTGAAGLNIGTFTVNVIVPPPSGAFTITGAQANSNGTVFTANIGDQLTMTSSEQNATLWGWDFGDGTGGSAQSVNKAYSTLGTYTVQLLVWGKAPDTTGTTISTFTVNVVSCVTNATTLCLNSNRFRASVAWTVPDQGKAGGGNAVSLTGDTGYYWFFSPTNIELVLKVVDGRPFNGNFWVFYGALSDVEYDITIKDMTTGLVKTYHNPYHTTASVADTNAFPGGGTSSAEPAVKKPMAAYSVTCSPGTVTVGQQVTCTVSPNGTYQWEWGETFPPNYQPGPNPNTHTYNTVGTRTVTVTSDGGVSYANTTVAVTAGGGGTITPTITGPSTGTTGSAVTFNGSATGGTAPYSYAWDCNYNAGSPQFVAGTAAQPCTYTTAGVKTVGLRVTDSASTPGTGTATTTVTISVPTGPGLPSAAFTVDGASLNPATNRYEAEIGREVTFSATETNAAQWGWDFGDGATAGGSTPDDRVVKHTYQQLGTWSGALLVYGDNVHTAGLSIGTIPLTVLRCAAGPNTLCLNQGRFKVQVTWQSDSSSGVGTAVPVTSDTGQFWFLTSNNIELVLKVVDGTSFNGHFWVFYGALSNLEYDITVTDTTTGAVKTYHNPLGTTASVADVNAF